MKKWTVEPVVNSFLRTKYVISNNKTFDGLARKKHNVQIIMCNTIVNIRYIKLQNQQMNQKTKFKKKDYKSQNNG